MNQRRTVYRNCVLCEATCGLAIEVEGERVTRIRGDVDDPFSRGYFCVKAHALAELHEDPDRLREPVRRGTNGFEKVAWPDAYRYVGERLAAIRAEHGPDSIAVYIGNPPIHNLDVFLYYTAFARALGSRQRYTAGTADVLSKNLVCALLYGDPVAVPVPDIDRTDYLLVLGGNPVVSNGSLWTAPGLPRRLDALRRRGGRLVVVDPRRTETAERADEHIFIRPGGDAFLLLAMVHVLFAEQLVRLGKTEGLVQGLDHIEAAVGRFQPEAVEARCGVPAATIRRLARELAAARRGVVYGRLGTCTQEFGTLAGWAVELLNILTGHLDMPGGAIFARPAVKIGAGKHPRPGTRRIGRWKSRVHNFPEVLDELPSATLADEILTPGEGRVRALVTIAGNPVLSVANSARLEEALGSLDFMLSIDMYVNETTRHAHTILPPTSPIEHATYAWNTYQFAVENFSKYSPAVFDKPAGAQHEWEILASLAGVLSDGADAEAVDTKFFEQLLKQEIGTDPRWDGLTTDEARAGLAGLSGPERLLDLYLRLGAWGDGFGRDPEGLTFARLAAEPHGHALGPSGARLPEVLRTPSHKIEAAPEYVMADLGRLHQALDRPTQPLVLIGRRDVRSNNSWLHNARSLRGGAERCVLKVAGADAKRVGLATGDYARVTSRVGSVVAPVEVTDELMPGVVSLPHGWGHDKEGTQLRVASQRPGVNMNALVDHAAIDVPSGSSVMNGVPVSVERAERG